MNLIYGQQFNKSHIKLNSFMTSSNIQFEGSRTGANFQPHKKQQYRESKPVPFSRTSHSQWKDKKPKPLSFQNQDDFANTASKLSKLNFQHHDPELCVCDSCDCGRHLCKLHFVKPTLSKSSMYSNTYNKKKPIPNPINNDKEYQKLEGPHIGMSTGYRKQFSAREGDKTERPKPQDLLKTGGPSAHLTSYRSGYPGYKGSNQYIKPTNKSTRPQFPLMGKSTYAQSFSNHALDKPKRQKIYDNLKSGSGWFGQTSYSKSFKEPNPEDFAKKVKSIEKLQKNPSFNHQFETTYKNNFLAKMPTTCPAKVKLETKLRGSFDSSKDRFAENSDFKSMSKQFHAISTSKHSYV